MRALKNIALLGLVGILAACGCSGTPRLVPAKGKVQWGDKAVGNVTVAFWWADEGGDPARKGYGLAFTEKDGSFVIKDMYGREGVFPGKYKVTFSMYVDAKGNPMPPGTKPNEVYGVGARDLMPKIYQDPRTTPVEVEVPSGGLDTSFTVPTK